MPEPTGVGNTGLGNICPQGHYCPEGSVVPLGCPAGYYTELTTQETCSPCPEGYYCLQNATTYEDTICPEGEHFKVKSVHLQIGNKFLFSCVGTLL